MRARRVSSDPGRALAELEPNVAPRTQLERHILQVLCHGRPLLTALNSTPANVAQAGLFSQLNFIAQVLLEALLRGERPAPGVLYQRTRLVGYGGEALGAYFQPFSCADAAPDEGYLSALAAIRSARRHQLVSRFIHIVFQSTDPPSATEPRGTYDVALHVRRGDKLTEPVREEQVVIWKERDLAEHVRAQLPSGDRVWHALLASDDNGYAQRLAAMLQQRGAQVHVIRNDREVFAPDNSSLGAAWRECDKACVAPLLALARRFSAAKLLMLGSRSNLGTWALSWWPAANGDSDPSFVDLDARVWGPQFSKHGKYFCTLHWGSRRGLCKSNETMSKYMRRAALRRIKRLETMKQLESSRLLLKQARLKGSIAPARAKR